VELKRVLNLYDLALLSAIRANRVLLPANDRTATDVRKDESGRGKDDEAEQGHTAGEQNPQ
jgi:hypothetical protein